MSGSQSHIRKVAVIGGNRIPFQRSNSGYSHNSNLQLLSAALQGLVERFHLQGVLLGEVAGGAVLKHSRDFNLVREAALSTELDNRTPAYDIQQACGTGLEAAILVANKIALGQIDAGIACGSDTTSDAPIAVGEKFRKLLLELNRSRTLSARLKVLSGFRPGHLLPAFPGVVEPRTGLSMGGHCEEMVKEWHISREAQDDLAYASHHKLLAAYREGFFEDLITPFNGVERDGVMRDTPREKLALLRPAFDQDHGTLTAANSTTLTDGAAAVLLASEEWARERNLPVQAYLSFGHSAAVDFFTPGEKEGMLMAPAYAVPAMLERAGLKLQDFDFYEIHEAFAGQVLCTLKAWESEAWCQAKLGRGALGEIDRDRLNVKGSSLATGHPFAATGARIVATLAKLLDQKGHGHGLISICAAGGQGVCAILEK